MPGEITVHPTIYYPVRGTDIEGNLVIPCNVSGTPTPVVTWLRNENQIVNQTYISGHTLVLNITREGIEASQTGIRYHCVATSRIGPSDSIAASVRSRDVIVTFACKLSLK
jgi:hypothetical protein